MEIYNGTNCVYLLTNRINGKMYVGITKHQDNPNERWHGGGKHHYNKHVARAVAKYGWDNFDHEILTSNLTREEAGKFERLLIAKLDLMNKDKGYNMTPGGDDLPGAQLPHLREGSRRHAKKVSKPVHQYGLDGRYLASYESTKGAARAIGVTGQAIRSCCIGKFRTSGDYYWSYQKMESYIPPEILPANVVETYQYSLSGEFIAKYDSMTKAAEAVGTTNHALHHAIQDSKNGFYRTSAGYIWTDGTYEPITVQKENPHKLQIICVETGDVFDSGKEAADAYNTATTNISRAARDSNATACGYHWKYIGDAANIATTKQVRRVEDGLMYDSLSQAAKMIRCTRKTIKKYIESGTPLNGYHYEYTEPAS